MSDSFFEALSGLVSREVYAARKSSDDDRLAGVVADLATMLGKVIAITGDGDAVLIDKMLMAADEVIAGSAVEVGEIVAAINRLVQEGTLK